jgi:hypothetical protein
MCVTVNPGDEASASEYETIKEPQVVDFFSELSSSVAKRHALRKMVLLRWSGVGTVNAGSE